MTNIRMIRKTREQFTRDMEADAARNKWLAYVASDGENITFNYTNDCPDVSAMIGHLERLKFSILNSEDSEE